MRPEEIEERDFASSMRGFDKNEARAFLKRFAGNDVAGFLFAAYEEEVVPAAAALNRFGDLGFYILNRYQDDPRAHALLADPEIGPRMVPFLAMFQDQGFERLADDRVESFHSPGVGSRS